MSNFCPVVFRLLSASGFASPAGRQVISRIIKWRRLNSMKKKNWLLLIIILTASLLIAIVFWIYAKRIEHIENKIIHLSARPIPGMLKL